MPFMLRTSIYVLAAIVTLLILCSCGSTDESTLVSPGIPTPTPTASPPTPTPLPTPTPRPEGTLGAASSGYDRVTITPYRPPTSESAPEELADEQVLRVLATSNTESTAPYISQPVLDSFSSWLFMPLFLFMDDPTDENENPIVQQGISISYDISSDGLTYIFHLHPLARFTDGAPINASAIKTTWEYIITAPDLDPGGYVFNTLHHILGVREFSTGQASEAIGIVPLDERTLQVTLEQPLPTWILNLTHPLMGLFKAESAILNPEDWQMKPTGVGPYVLDHTPNVQKGVTHRLSTSRRSWWNQSPPAPEIEIMVVPDIETQGILYENGQVDLMLTGNLLQSASTNSVLQLDLQPHRSTKLSYFAYSSDSPPFNEWEVRAALSHGVDMNTIVGSVYGNMTSWAEGLIGKGVPCHQKEVGYRYNPKLARTLLSKSSYLSGNNLPEISLGVSGLGESLVAEMAVNQWMENIDTRVTIKRVGSDAVEPAVIGIRRAEINPPILDPGHLLSQIGASDSELARATTKHSNGNLDMLVRLANKTDIYDPDRCSRYNAVENEILDNYYILPYAQIQNETWIKQPWVLNWVTNWDSTIASLPYLIIGTRDKTLYE